MDKFTNARLNRHSERMIALHFEGPDGAYHAWLTDDLAGVRNDAGLGASSSRWVLYLNRPFTPTKMLQAKSKRWAPVIARMLDSIDVEAQRARWQAEEDAMRKQAEEEGAKRRRAEALTAAAPALLAAAKAAVAAVMDAKLLVTDSDTLAAIEALEDAVKAAEGATP